MGRAGRRDREFTEYVAARSAYLTRVAYLLCGGDRHRAEDLVQTALTKLYVAWERIDRPGGLDGYARQILVRANIDESRRPWRRELLVEPQVTLTATEPPTERPTSPLADELRRLPAGQRAAVVLRYWHDLSVEETARLMGCSDSTVKTQSARGLAKLRATLAATENLVEGGHDD